MSQLDPEGTRVRVYTFAEGMFSRLAHDLELEAPLAEVTGELDGAGDGHLDVSFRAGSVRVIGFVKKGVTDEHGPSGSDRADIVERMLAALGATAESTIRARVEKKGGRVTVDLEVPTGRAKAEAAIREEGGALVARLRYSMPTLGMKPVKGPLGAFRLADHVEVEVRAKTRA